MPHSFVATSCSQIERLRGLWESLHSPERHTLFQTYDWNALAAKVFSDRISPFVVAVENDACSAIIPACWTSHSVGLLGEELFDYRDVLVTGDDEVLLAGWAKLAKVALPLNVPALRHRDSLELWQSLGLAPKPFVSAPCVLRADNDAGTFESLHHRSGRLLRRLARAGVAFHEYPGTDSTLVRSIYESKAAQLL